MSSTEEQTLVFPVDLHGNVGFQQGGIGPVGNPGPQGVKGFQVSHPSPPVSISLHISRELTALMLAMLCRGLKEAWGIRVFQVQRESVESSATG